jgi:glycerol-1-phosphate dehydrogenase [NAD(P)+]
MSDPPDPLAQILAGRLADPDSGARFPCPATRVVVARSLDGAEADLVAALRLGPRLAVIADQRTWAVLGERVARALKAQATAVLAEPQADAATLDDIRVRTRHADALIAVGSGTVNDLCKAAAFKDRRRYAVFATAPSMNGYVTATASIAVRGLKHSLAARPPAGAFFDLAVLAAAPPRLIRAGIGDCLCRTTAQVDWLLGHLLCGTSYLEAPFQIQAEDEPLLLERAGAAAAGEVEAVTTLVRLLLLSGFGMALAGSSHPASMGEHLVSHYIDLLASPHPGSLHGEQVGVATWTLARLQARLLSADGPPPLAPTRIDDEGMRARYGPSAEDCLRALKRKAIDAAGAARLNARLAADWTRLRARLRAAMLPLGRLERAMREAELPMTGETLGLPAAFYRDAVRHARELRDRFGTLDLAADCGLLDEFAAGES